MYKHKKNIGDILALTPLQEGILFHYLKEPGRNLYFEQLCLEVSGKIDVRLFEKAWNHVIETNEILRTVFLWENVKKPVQVVLKEHKLQLKVYDLRARDADERPRLLVKIKQRDKENQFDLRRVSFRVTLCQLGEEEHVVIISNHHILYDGWSSSILLEEFFNTYRELTLGRPLVKPLKTKFKEFIKLLQSSDEKKQDRFWREYLDGLDTFTVLPIKMKSGELPGFDRPRLQHLELDETSVSGMETLAKTGKVTMAAILYTAWGILLQRYCNCDDIIFGTTVSGRSAKLKGIEDMVGLFINTLPLRVSSGRGKRAEDLVQSINQDLQAREEYENTPLVKIKEGYLHCDAYGELFDNIVVIENYPVNSLRSRLDHDETTLCFNSFSMVEMTNYDLTLSIAFTDTIGIDFIYNEETFEPGSIERLTGHFSRILADIITNPGKRACDIELLSKEEKRRILYGFNDTATNYPRDKTIHQLFEARVERSGDRCPVNSGELQITYGELNRRTNRLAHGLREKGAGPDTIVAIMIGRSVEMIIGILGILKAGGAYLPIDPGYPQERIDYMLKDSNAKIFLTGREIAGLSSAEAFNIQPQGASFHLDLLSCVKAPVTSLAYIIYTSGSTGQPKGVMVGHGNVVRLVVNTTFVKLSERTSILQTGAPVFDATTFEIWGALLNGGRLCLVSQETILDAPRLGFALKQYDINTLWLSSPLFNQLSGENSDIFASLEYLLVGGDVLSPSFINRVRSKNVNLKVINGYGPTENTTFSTTFLINKDYRDSIPIGSPISNSTAFVMSRAGRLQPVGVCGELWVGGDGLARGYLNQSELTAEKFISTRSFLGGPGGRFFKKAPLVAEGRLYKTGDLTRWLADGNIEFLGRIDFQVKIRGYRIELGEIENRLAAYDRVTDVVVVVREAVPGEKSLCAYIVAKTGFDMTRVHEFLSHCLPDYMIPSYFVQLEKIPLTANGKVDRKALPEPGINASAREYVPPGNAVEKTLVQIWQEVLGIKQVGITDNFFQIGGDSIKAIQVAARLRKHRLVLSINDIFRNPDIRKLGKCVTGIEREIPQGPVEGEVELTPIQHWFFQKDFTAKHHFNHSIMLYRRDGFAVEILEKVFTALVSHHDALRMRYEFGEEHVRQWNRGLESPLFDFEVFDMKGMEKFEEKITGEADRIQSSINLETGPLLKLGLFKTPGGDHLLVVIHHLVVDGVSWRILLEDFNTGYNQAMQGKDICFPGKTDSFQYWSRRLNQYALGNTGTGGKTVLKDLDYWSKIALEEIEPLPVDREVPASGLNCKNNGIIRVTLDNQETQRLLKEVNWAYNTEIDDVLLTALGLALKDWRGVEKFSVNMEGHGREPVIHEVDISRTVGWFTAIFPVIVDMRRWQDVSYALKWVKETRRRIPDKGFGYGVLKYITPGNLKGGVLFELEPGITFNYMGQFQQADRASSVEKNDGRSFGRSWVSTGSGVGPGFETTSNIEINGIMVDDRLQFSFDFNSHRYRSESIQSLADCYKERLLTLIRHCVSRQNRELTPSDLGYNKINLEDFSTIVLHVKNNMGTDKKIQCLYPLSPMQSGMLYHAYANRSSPVYFEQSAFVIKGEMDYRVLKHSFNRLVEQYDIFRTNFLFEGLPEPLQVVLEQREADFFYEDISHLQDQEEGVQAAYLEEFKRKDRDRGFDLSADRLIRWALLRTDRDTCHLVWSFHHILMDGWCLGIVFKELIRLYRLLKENRPVQPEPVFSYGDYIKWLARQDREEGLKYWESYLESFEKPTSIPKLGPAAEGDGFSYKPGEYQWIIEETVSARIRDTARQNQVTVNTVFQVSWGILLGKYNNCEDVVFGAVVSGRSPEIEGIESMVGLFINTVPVRVKTRSYQTVSQLLKEVREDTASAKSYEYLSLADIQARSPLKGNLIDHIVVFENYPISDSIKDIAGNLDQDGLFDFHPELVSTHSQTNYDFNVIIIPGDCLTVNFMYNNLVYHAEWVNSMGRHLKEIVRQVTDDPGVITADIEIITKEEKQQILFDFNDTAADYPKNKTVIQLFEEQVDRCGDRCSAIKGEVQVAYGELNRRANRLAHGLQGKGAGPDCIVAMMMERSVEMMVGILGILKAGGAYLPIDPGYPGERVQYMLKDSNARVLLTTAKLQVKVKAEVKENSRQPRGLPLQFITIERNLATTPGSLPSTLTATSTCQVSPANLAYIIYTSGSTGLPKGVMVEHRALNAYVNAFLHEFELTENTAVIQQATYSFDTFGEEVYPVLSRGGRIVIAAKDEVMDVGLFAKVIAGHGIDMVDCSPLVLDQLNREEFLDLIKNVKLFISGGDVLKGSYINNLLKTGKVWNTYGPTEATICASYYRCTQSIEGNVPIGRPIANYNIHILDKYSVLQSVGVPGELCIIGPGLARGYLNQPELTAKKFISNKSFLGGPGGQFFKNVPLVAEGKLYKTGDLARWLFSGDLEFLGRIDHQVKIRGFRIELGEIENRLLRHKEIKQAVVLANQKEDGEDGDRYLCAYIVAEGSGNYREYLSQILPGYMIPSFLVQLESIPLTPSGKVDCKALPWPGIGKGEEFTPPRNQVEIKLAEIWSEVLGVRRDAIGIDTNFFEAGGHSLKAAVLVSRIFKDLGVEIPLADVFKSPTLRSLAAIIAAAGGAGIPGIPGVEKREYYPLSYNQQRMYILHQLAPASPAYNMPGYIRLGHATDEGAVMQVLNRLIARHHSFRTLFRTTAEGVGQFVRRDLKIPFEVIDISAADRESKRQKAEEIYAWQAAVPFDLNQAPLFRAKLVKMDAEDYVLMFNMHHIISDGWSLEILKQEFGRLYEAVRAGEDIVLPYLPLQYTDFTQWHNRQLKSGPGQASAKSWKEKLAGGVPVLQLPGDREVKKGDVTGAAYECLIDESLKNRLKKAAV
ncbi:MAG: amino acid adenylation domain-containing protein, partial [Candidatus Aminicenantes bacterium]